MTKVDRLLARIQRADFKPRIGDVFKRKDDRATYVCVAIGQTKPAGVEPRITLFKYLRGDWTEAFRCPLSEWGRMDNGSRSFKLVDAGFTGFIFLGFSPANTGRAYVMFKRTAGVILRAGCRSFTTYAAAARHWRSGSMSDNASEKKAIAKEGFRLARAYGWLTVKRDRPVKKAKRR